MTKEQVLWISEDKRREFWKMKDDVEKKMFGIVCCSRVYAICIREFVHNVIRVKIN